MSKRTHPSTTTTTISKKPRRSNRVAQQKYGPCWIGTTSDLNTTLVLDTRKNQASHYDAKKSRLNLLQDVWEYKIVPLLNVSELVVLRPTCTWFEQRWQDFLARNQICVPQDVPTIDQAMFFASILSEQKEFTKDSPLIVLLSEGEHVVKGSLKSPPRTGRALDIPCENISFVGQGSNKTIVCGGLVVMNKKNVTLKNLTLTAPDEFGLHVHGEEALVELLDVSFQKCGESGIEIALGATVNATQCEFRENGHDGVHIDSAIGAFTDCTFQQNGKSGVSAGLVGALVEFRGERTEIQHNNHFGLNVGPFAIIKIYIQERLRFNHENKAGEFRMFPFARIQFQLLSSSLELTDLHDIVAF